MTKNLRAIGSIGIVITILIIIFVWSSSSTNKLDDFNKTKQEFQSGNYSKIFDLKQEYYTRTDFYPLSFGEQNALYGYGAYPGEVTAKITGFTTGNKFDSYTFVHASPSVYSFQGMKLSMQSTNKDLFNIEIAPSDILLSPAPLDNWTYKIKVTITSKKDIPKGEYKFKLVAESPSSGKDIEYRNKVNGTYVGKSPIQPDKFFDITLKVDE